MRTAGASAVICITSWLGLQIGAGATGLQRAVSTGPLSLLDRPLALVLVGVASVGLAFIIARLVRSLSPLLLTGLILLGDVIGAVILAPLLVGELSPAHAPTVFVILTALGVQPLGVLVGGWTAHRLRGSSSQAETVAK